MFIEKSQLIFLYTVSVGWTGGRAFDQHSRNGGPGICQQKLPAGWVFVQFFSNAGGGRMLAVGIDSHINSLCCIWFPKQTT